MRLCCALLGGFRNVVAGVADRSPAGDAVRAVRFGVRPGDEGTPAAAPPGSCAEPLLSGHLPRTAPRRLAALHLGRVTHGICATCPTVSDQAVEAARVLPRGLTGTVPARRPGLRADATALRAGRAGAPAGGCRSFPHPYR
ncbi:hypothetical protein SUDANB6_03889 [Streptomyces sp. enrichment culture]